MDTITKVIASLGVIDYIILAFCVAVFIRAILWKEAE